MSTLRAERVPVFGDGVYQTPCECGIIHTRPGDNLAQQLLANGVTESELGEIFADLKASYHPMQASDKPGPKKGKKASRERTVALSRSRQQRYRDRLKALQDDADPHNRAT